MSATARTERPAPQPRSDVPRETLDAQAAASDPSGSAWVSANAGSGKTYVLTQRVVRLLLSGVEPSRILCLTYTRAAAAEMANRVFRDLGDWALKGEEELRAAIREIEGIEPSDDRVLRARTLFARALETPGGLKIQTIHAFCEALLRQFPLESNVPARFTVLQDEAQTDLLAQVRQAVQMRAREQEGTALAQAFERVLETASDHAIDAAFAHVLSARASVADWLAADASGSFGEHARAAFGLEPDATPSTVVRAWHEADPEERDALLEVARRASDEGSTKDRERARPLLRAFETRTPDALFEACAATFLTADGALRKAMFTQKVVPKSRLEWAESVMARFFAAHDRVRTLALLDASADFFVLAREVLALYEAEKRARGLLDFDDMVRAAVDLLERRDAAAWIHYKLDRGIEHVLIDEAQDTSPHQWRIVRRLVEEFFSGEGAWEPSHADERRTLFAVGDEKQSIFSFQGARPEEFARQRDHFRRAAEPHFRRVPLRLSFRSTRDVLAAVDRVFDHGDHGTGLTGDPADYVGHDSTRGDQRGQVDIWPLIVRDEDAQAKRTEPPDWTEPLDAPPLEALQLAERIADRIRLWLDRKERLEGHGRPVRAGDILVLVRARDAFVPALTRELKKRRVPVAGADRLQIATHIAVEDLLALSRALLLPDDDFSLACALKSPIFGWSEDDLYRHAQGREGALHASLVGSDEGRGVLERLERWRRIALEEPPFDYFCRLVGPEGLRSRFHARLGPEVDDVLDGFLQAALDHEADGPGDLQGFIETFSRSQVEIKREMDDARDRVRIMTVHAAKGLEAPVVFLVDKGTKPEGATPPVLFPWPNGEGWVWVPSSDRHVLATRHARDAHNEAALHEHRRLLYVAMTRAADRLVVCGYLSAPKPPDHSWHRMVEAALGDEAVAQPVEDGFAPRTWRMPDDRTERVEPDDDGEPPAPAPVSVREWHAPLAREEQEMRRPLTPSGAQALVDEDTLRASAPLSILADAPTGGGSGGAARAMRRGTLLHRLLQTLPNVEPAARREVALRFLDDELPDAASAVDAVLRVLDAPDTGALFGPASRAEVAVMGRLRVGGADRMVSGQIDRLLVEDDRVVIADFKTGRNVPARPDLVPEPYLAQMALYRALVARLYPGRPVHCDLVWTHAVDGPQVMRLPSAQLDAALEAIARA